MKNEINREFEKRGIQSEARFACEYVLGLMDETWRDVIEGYLGGRRYTILVEPEYYDIADDVLNASKYKYAHLFNTKLLMRKDIKPVEDSVVQFIDAKNQVAKNILIISWEDFMQLQLIKLETMKMLCLKKAECLWQWIAILFVLIE